MKNALLMGACAIVLATVPSAFAADMPVKAPAPASVGKYPAVSTWTGYYVGLQGGYAWDRIGYTYVPDASTTDFKYNGFVGGGTAGYNWQSGSWVFGIEADISYADVDGSILTTTTPCLSVGEGCSAELSWFGTARLRFGLPVGDLLPYVTGGVAVGRISGSADTGACAATVCGYEKTATGWTAGAGAEWRFGGNWSAKIEYLFLDLGSPTFNRPSVTSSDFEAHIVRGGVNFRF